MTIVLADPLIFVELTSQTQSNVILSFEGLVRRKVMVLDLDETLIHSHHDGVLRQTVKPGTPPDFVLKVSSRHRTI